MRRNVKFRPTVDGLESRVSLSDLPTNGIGQDGSVGGYPPPGTTVQVEPAPVPYDPFWDALKIGVADGFTAVVSYGTYTYSSGFISASGTAAPTTTP